MANVMSVRLRVSCGYFLSVLLLFFPVCCDATGFVICVSTPLTPPKGFLWTIPAFLTGIVVFDLMMLLNRRSLWKTLIAEMVTLGLSIIIFLAVGFLPARGTSAPPPCLGLPHDPFFGLPWTKVWWIFLFWNGLGLMTILAGKLLLFRFKRPAHAWLVLVGDSVIFALLLVPYLWFHAPVHGWAGSYVRNDCVSHLCMVGEAIAGYAQHHGGILPETRTDEEFVRVVRPYLPEKASFHEGWHGDDLFICPLEGVRERKPRVYHWNAYFAGRDMSPLTALAQKAIGAIKDESIKCQLTCPLSRRNMMVLQVQDLRRPVLSCPAHHGFGNQPTLYVVDLMTSPSAK